MIYQGSCHCGNIVIEAEGELDRAIQCNCSICSKRGSLLWFVPRDKLKLKSEPRLSTYTFNKHRIKHHFCPTCGCAPFAEGTGPAGEAMAAINVRCLNDVEMSAVAIVPFDGRSL